MFIDLLIFIFVYPYEYSDVVLDVKTSLVVDPVKVEKASLTEKYGVHEQDWFIRYDFVLTTPDETNAIFEERARDQQ